MQFEPMSPLEQSIVKIAEQQGSLAELCVLVDYYTDKGRVPEHFRPRHDVLQLVRALGAPRSPSAPRVDQLQHMAYQLRLVPDGEVVPAQLLDVLRDQFNAAMDAAGRAIDGGSDA